MKKTLFTLLVFCIACSAQAQIIDIFAHGASSSTAAVNRHHANQVLDYVSQCAIAAQMKNDGAINTKDTCGTLLPNTSAPLSLNGKKFTISEGRDSTFTITSPTIEADDVRSNIVLRSNSMVSIKESGKKVKFIFKK